jgi:6-pyruvoyltetrahydropterin/6-carboxytetrahydropterin synthase
MFDHTMIVAEDDPYLENFKEMWKDGIIQLRVIPTTGAEQFAKYIYEKLNTFIQEETNGRVKIVQVEFKEHEKNTAFYKEDIKHMSKTDIETYLNDYRSNSKYEF